MKLKQALDAMTVTDLRNMANVYHLTLPQNAFKDALVQALLGHLTTPAVIERTLVGLSPAERTALDALVAEGGRMMSLLFIRDYGAIRPADPYGYGFGLAKAWSDPETAAEGLFVRGLIYKEYGETTSWRGEFYSIPDELLHLLPKVKKPSFAELLAAAHEPRYLAIKGDLLRDIGMFVCYLKRETVRPVHGDRLAKRDILRFNEDLSLRYPKPEGVRAEGDVPWMSFVHHLAQLSGLIRVQGSLLTISDKAEAWLGESRDRQLRQLWQRYQKDSGWSEIEKAISKQSVYGAITPQHVLAARNRVLDALKQCPVGTWLTIAGLERAIKTYDPGFLRVQQSPESNWSYWSAAQFLGGWDQIEGALIRYLLSTTLCWFGIVQAGATSEEGADPVFRVTEAGAILLDIHKGTIPEPVSQPIVVQANFEIITPAETSPAVLFQVQQVADLSKRDRASIYVLTPNAVWRNLQMGGDIERIISFLEQANQRPLPQNITYSLREWAGKHGELTVDQVTLLQASSDALMAEVRANRKIGLKVKDSISPRAVTLPERDVSTLIEQLKKAGYWPKVGETIVDTAEANRAAGSEMTIKVSQLVQLLAAASVLEHIAEENGWTPPVADWLIRNLSWRLAPPHLKQLGRLTSEAIAAHEASAENDKKGR